MCRVVAKHFDGRNPILVTTARHWVGDHLIRWQLDDAGTAEWLTSELVTNAIRHGGGSPTLTLSLGHGILEVGVSDSDTSHLPHPLDHQHGHDSQVDEGGRGLAIIDILATEWGTTVGVHGKHVWFRLDAKDWPHTAECDCDTAAGTQLESGRMVHHMPDDPEG